MIEFLMGCLVTGLIMNFFLYRETVNYNKQMKEHINYYNNAITEHWKLLSDLGEAFVEKNKTENIKND